MSTNVLIGPKPGQCGKCGNYPCTCKKSPRGLFSKEVNVHSVPLPRVKPLPSINPKDFEQECRLEIAALKARIEKLERAYAEDPNRSIGPRRAHSND